MFCTSTAGLPGRYFVRNGAITRAVASVPPPAAEPTITVMVLPRKVTGSCAAAGAQASAARSDISAQRIEIVRDMILMTPRIAARALGVLWGQRHYVIGTRRSNRRNGDESALDRFG